jgi:hypothetical protein
MLLVTNFASPGSNLVDINCIKCSDVFGSCAVGSESAKFLICSHNAVQIIQNSSVDRLQFSRCIRNFISTQDDYYSKGYWLYIFLLQGIWIKMTFAGLGE